MQSVFGPDGIQNSKMASAAYSSSHSAIPLLDQPAFSNACGANGFSIFPKASATGSTDYDCVLPIGVLYHCLVVSTAEQCIRTYSGRAQALVQGKTGGKLNLSW